VTRPLRGLGLCLVNPHRTLCVNARFPGLNNAAARSAGAIPLCSYSLSRTVPEWQRCPGHCGRMAQAAGRALGVAPSTAEGVDGVDALLWVKTPGVSDGVCSAGQPRAGVYWPEYARSLVVNAGR